MSYRIKEQPNVFDDHFLDIIGNEFKFDHVKGQAEWIKNSADAYTREDISDENQYVLLRLSPKGQKEPSRFECVDFMGMTKQDVDKAFKRWGDPHAAARGSGRRVLGGHGNGGKFYMRQMFKTSRFLTYRDGKLNVFGFNEHRKYGYAEGFENKALLAEKALEFAGLKDIDVPKAVRNRWAKKGVGFTVVTGENPEKIKSWGKTIETIAKRLPLHPQSRRLVKHKQIIIINDGAQFKIEPATIAPRPGFEGPYKIVVPAEITRDGQTIQLKNDKYPEAYLILNTSAQPFNRIGEMSALNSIDILGEVGCIGSYRLNELGYLRYAAQAEFLYGECYCPILEDPSDDCVRNDREKLVETEKTEALLSWIREQVDDLCEKMAQSERSERKQKDLEQSSAFNELLNRWKNKFMGKVFSEILGGSKVGDSWGGLEGGGSETDREGKGKDGKKAANKGGNEGEGGGGSGTEKKHAPRFPRVLLSGYDADPLNTLTAESLTLDPGHPAVYQRFEDVKEGIYWINTSRPLAERIIAQYSVKSTRWREYLFQRYVDIIVKEAIYQKASKDPNLTAETVDSLIDNVIQKVHDGAAIDLEAFLFEEAFGMEGVRGEDEKKKT